MTVHFTDTGGDAGDRGLDRLETARRRRDLRLDDLQAIAEWREDLIARIARFTLKFHYVDCFSPEYEALVEEVDDFRTICFAIAGEKGGPA